MFAMFVVISSWPKPFQASMSKPSTMWKSFMFATVVQSLTCRERSPLGQLLGSRVRCLLAGRADLAPLIGVSCTQNSFGSLLC